LEFNPPLIEGFLLRRYKRFLADIRLKNGKTVTAHCPNTGSMTGLANPGSRVYLSPADPDKNRRLPYTWEIVEVGGETLVGIHTGLTNRLVVEAIQSGVVKELQGYKTIRTEVPYGREASRIDLLLEGKKNAPACYVEVKNATTARGKVVLFPDAVSSRGTKHLRELMYAVDRGYRAVVFFCVQRADVRRVEPADRIDPLYGKTLRLAIQSGVEGLAYQARVLPGSITLRRTLPLVCPKLDP
jgi:sugar fermentation stimulation protein A